MISFVIASLDQSKLQAAEAMLAAAMGDQPWELAGLHRAPSLAQGYNAAVPDLKGDIVVFCHDDVTILNPDFPQRLQHHLQRFDIVGVAGATRIIQASWAGAGPPFIFGQIVYPNPNGSFSVQIYSAPRPAVGNIQVLDGLLIAMRRSVLDRCLFDPDTFDGFHFYDLDFCLSAYTAGLRLAVANDINVMHQSEGQYDQAWYKYAVRFMKKWAAHVGPHTDSPPFRWANIRANSTQEALEVMNPSFWRQP